jgi:hypothetical protein
VLTTVAPSFELGVPQLVLQTGEFSDKVGVANPTRPPCVSSAIGAELPSYRVATTDPSIAVIDNGTTTTLKVVDTPKK